MINTRNECVMIVLDRCKKCCNTLDNTSGRICLLNKTDDVTLIVFNMIAKIN